MGLTSKVVILVFHDELDFVSVHEALLQEFKSALESIRGRQSLESQIDIIVKAKASNLVERKALQQVSIRCDPAFRLILTVF